MDILHAFRLPKSLMDALYGLGGKCCRNFSWFGKLCAGQLWVWKVALLGDYSAGPLQVLCSGHNLLV